MYQYEILVPRLSMNLAGMYSEPVSTVPDTPVDSATPYLRRIKSSSVVVDIITCEAECQDRFLASGII